jgi:hypothetical protein
MRKKLPLELRNVIYTYACVEEKPLWIKRIDRVEPKRIAALRRACEEGLSLRNISMSCGYCPFEGYDEGKYCENHCESDTDALDEWEELHTRTILDPRYVGEEIALEAAEVYYGRNVFCLEYDELLWGFLQENILGLPGVTPADHVRRLRVVLRCEPLGLAKPGAMDAMDCEEEQFRSEREFLGLLSCRQRRCLQLLHERGRLQRQHASIFPPDQLHMYNTDKHRGPRLQVSFVVKTQLNKPNQTTTLGLQEANSWAALDAQRTCYNIAEALWPQMRDWSATADLRGIFHENGHLQGMLRTGYHTTEVRPLITRAMLEHRCRVGGFEKAFEDDKEDTENIRWSRNFISSPVAQSELKKEGLEKLIEETWGVDSLDIDCGPAQI